MVFISSGWCRYSLQTGLAILEEAGLTLDLQSYPATLPHIPAIAAKFPKLKAKYDPVMIAFLNPVF